MENFIKNFDKIYCVNLNRRPDRLEEVQKEFERVGLSGIERFEAIDGSTYDWSHTKSHLLVGELGLIETHINIIKEAIDKKYESILIFEDDVYFNDEFLKIDEYMVALPTDWEMLYLGGNHTYGRPPEHINNKVLRLNRTYTTHAIAIKSSLFELILENTKLMEKQIDVYYADLHTIKNVYGFSPNLALQRIDFSDIQNRQVSYNF